VTPEISALSRRVADLGVTVRTLQLALEEGELADSESLRRVIQATKHLQGHARAELAVAARQASIRTLFPDDEHTVVDATCYPESTP
jgi:hypothetical protein